MPSDRLPAIAGLIETIRHLTAQSCGGAKSDQAGLPECRSTRKNRLRESDEEVGLDGTRERRPPLLVGAASHETRREDYRGGWKMGSADPPVGWSSESVSEEDRRVLSSSSARSSASDDGV